ncbi:hypothetical protein MRS44_015615 [Fusarium solani]|uniref:SET domain-containing protein n=1 Tax=Fusarium solani TaxID=169388 RepID=A0A9P9HAZ8_FUSSL|nr:uncharacterized protein B0J15DRAFT_526572 [Fusarium solani]KAH7253224.1 hypothetical protein B0J15DRAFT_526572 [Fusarium solani]KAJ3459542.1 hypothetical protein MRS44_015615 [Fusarium solani]
MKVQQILVPKTAPRSKLRPSNTFDSAFYIHPHLAPDQDPCKGRLLRASAAVREGTVLLIDTPYAIVPSVNSDKEDLICSNLSCSRRVPRDGHGVRCHRNCFQDVVWCNTACRAADHVRHGFECLWLKEKGELIRDREGQYNFVTIWHVVRLLATWNMELKSGASMSRHRYPRDDEFSRGWKAVEMCCSYLDSWPESQINHWKRLAEEYLSDASVLPCVLSPDEMLSLICKEETNTFGLYPKVTGPLYMIDHPTARGDSYGLSLYPRAAMFNHSCLPNVTHKPDAQGRMVYTAARDIAKGEECMITYFDLTVHEDVTSRQKHVQEQFQFKCTCDRCLSEEAEENLENMDCLPFGF